MSRGTIKAITKYFVCLQPALSFSLIVKLMLLIRQVQKMIMLNKFMQMTDISCEQMRSI